MKFVKKLVFGFCVSLILMSGSAEAENVNVQPATGFDIVYLAPEKEGHKNPFWLQFELLLANAAQDLGDNLEILYGDEDHYKLMEYARQLAAREDKPDAVMFLALGQKGPEIIDILNKAGIYTLLVNYGMTEEQLASEGEPREKYEHWLADVLPDEFHAGYLLMQELYEEAKKKGVMGKNGKINVVGFAGGSTNANSVGRIGGMNKFISEHDDIELLQSIPAKWERDIAHKKMAHILKRYDDIQIVWAASATMSMGVLDAYAERPELKPGQDVMIGGIDWSSDEFHAMKDGKMNVSVGGHFLDGAWSLVLLHDYLSGIDFKDDPGYRVRTKMHAVNTEQLPVLEKTLQAADKIDFKEFSKAYNPEMKTYNFNPFEF